MLKLVIFLSAVVSALSASNPEGSPQFFITGGTDTTISKYPWQVSIRVNGKHNCGGSIYNNKIIVTAAHCLMNWDVSSLSVRVGATKYYSGGTVIPVAAFKTHEGYNTSNFENDIGVIRLASFVEYSSTVKNIALATSTPDNGVAAEATGWGKADGHGPLPEFLQHISVKIVGRSQCSSSPYMQQKEEIKPSMICATAPGKHTCVGDSGGPLVSGGILVGVSSFGKSSCNLDAFPDVYTDVAYLRPWIINAASSV